MLSLAAASASSLSLGRAVAPDFDAGGSEPLRHLAADRARGAGDPRHLPGKFVRRHDHLYRGCTHPAPCFARRRSFPRKRESAVTTRRLASIAPREGRVAAASGRVGRKDLTNDSQSTKGSCTRMVSSRFGLVESSATGASISSSSAPHIFDALGGKLGPGAGAARRFRPALHASRRSARRGPALLVPPADSRSRGRRACSRRRS